MPRPYLSDSRARVHEYLGGTLRGMEGLAHAVGGTGDHVHVLAGLKASHRLAGLAVVMEPLLAPLPGRTVSFYGDPVVSLRSNTGYLLRPLRGPRIIPLTKTPALPDRARRRIHLRGSRRRFF
jgi:hypothetical protein